MMEQIVFSTAKDIAKGQLFHPGLDVPSRKNGGGVDMSSAQASASNKINTRPNPLVPRMPGSKRRHLPEWAPILSQDFDTVVEYFGGALWVAQALLQAERPTVKQVIVAEAATDLRAIYEIWGGWLKSDREVARVNLQAKLTEWQTLGIEKSWPKIKALYENRQENGYTDVQAAAAGLALRVLTVSGIVRDTPGSGRLNVVPNKSQLKRWSAYNPEWPKSPDQKIEVFEDFKHLKLPDDCSNTLAICDPPYCGRLGKAARRGGHYISPAYFGHRPHEQFTADMAVDSVALALAHGCRTVIACNYNAGWLDLSYRGMAARYGYSCDRTIRGSLTGLNNNVKPAKRESPYRDTYWVFQKIGVVGLEVAA